MIPSDPPKVVHLITRAQGGLHDYQAFLHEAGHALHYAGCDPSLPYTFRNISRDHALTEIYSYIVEAISREPGWHARYFGLSDEQAAAERGRDGLPRGAPLPALRGEAAVRARLLGPLRRGRRHRRGLRRAAHRGDRACEYRREGYLADMDAGFYSADYLRAWIRAAQLRSYLEREVGDEWWRSKETGDRLRELFREGTKPSSEEIAGRIGFEPLDTGPLLAELGA